MQAAGIDADQQSAGGILEGNLLRDVALLIIAGDDTFDLDICIYLGIVTLTDDITVILLQFLDRNYLGFLNAVVAIGRIVRIQFWRGIVRAHTRSKKACDAQEQRIFDCFNYFHDVLL